MINFYKKHVGILTVYTITLGFLVLGTVTEYKLLSYAGIMWTAISCWISYLQGYADSTNRENALKVVHTLKEDTDRVVIKEYAGEHDDLSNEATYEYDKKWQDKFRHVVTHKRTW